MTTVRLEPEADEELGAAARWYEAQREGLGHEFIDAADEAISRIASPAHGSSPVPGVELPVRRIFMKRFPYAVVFMATTNEIVIVAFAHVRRRPGYWSSRLRG